jgi:C4-dicarboxylate transporter DctQ subunit
LLKFPANDSGNFTGQHALHISFQFSIALGNISGGFENYWENGMATRDGKMRKNAFDFIIEGLTYLAGIIILAITFAVTVSALVRYLGFRAPIWTLQYTEYGLLWFTFLGAAWLLREEGHIRIDTVISRLYAPSRRKVEIIDDILGFIVSIAIFCFGTLHTVDLYQRGIMEVKGVIVPKFLFFLIIPLGGLALSIQFVRNFLKKIKSKPGRGEN